MTEESSRRAVPSWLPPALFVAVVGCQCWLLNRLGFPSPGGLRADTNVYLELAMNLFQEGTYGSKVSVSYPPLYPMVLSPLFAVESNATRFTLIYILHGLLLAGGALTLLPALRQSLGRAGAWYALALVQCSGAFLLHGYQSQTESLFTALIVAAAGMTWRAWNRPQGWAWIGLGLLCGLAVCTRRTGLVLPVALGLLLAHDLARSLHRKESIPWRALALCGLGLGLGLVPEAVASALHGEVISPYGKGGGGAAAGHLKAGLSAFGSFEGLRLLVEVMGRHLAYLSFTTFGAPLVLGIVLLGHRLRPLKGLPLPTARVLGFAAYVALGLSAMSTLHILRYRLGRPNAAGYDIYPRYVDPAEGLLMFAGLLGLAWWMTSGSGREASRALKLRLAGPFVAANAAALLLAGPLRRPRAARLPSPERLESWGFTTSPELVVPIVSAAVLVLWFLWWLRGFRRPLVVVAVALVLSQVITLASPIGRWQVGWSEDRMPEVLRLPALQKVPTAPIAVLVRRVGPFSRRYYEPAFRSEHPVSFVATGEPLRLWMAEHPDGFVLTHRKDPKAKLERVGKTKDWKVYRSRR